MLPAAVCACALALAVQAPAQTTAAAQAPRDFVVAGYVFPGNAILRADQVDARALNRIMYAFAIIKKGRMVEGANAEEQNIAAQNLAALASLRGRNPSLQILVSVGGWSGSAGFSDAALTAQSRSVFVASAVAFIRRYDLDGIDVDWEYPGMAGASRRYRAEDKSNLTLLLKDMREALDREEKPAGRKLLLTIATGNSEEYLQHTEMNRAQRYVDTVNLMTYDYALASEDAVTGHSAPLFDEPAAPDRGSVDASVRAFERAGVPASKLLLGVAFYGHLWGKVSGQNHGLFQPGKPVPGDFASFSDIEHNLLGQGFTRYWDAIARVPYLYSAERQVFVSYEDAESLALKCGFVREQNLAGVMFWEYSQDPSGQLLETIDRTLREPKSRPR